MDRATLPNDISTSPAERLRDLHSDYCAKHAAILACICEIEADASFTADGAPSIEAWVSSTLGVSFGEAKRWVEAARALAELPALSSSYEDGHLSWDKLKTVTKFATPEIDAAVAKEAEVASLSALQSAARRAEATSLEKVREAHRSRSLMWWWDEDGSHLNHSGRMPADQGVKFERVLERFVKKQPYDPDEPMSARAADALMELISGRVAEDQTPDRAAVVLFTTAETLAAEHRSVEALGGATLHPETARRLSCDCWLQNVQRDEIGNISGVGISQRTPPAWLARQVYLRDGYTCSFPGCDRKHFLHIHHIVHWGRGGPTDLDNLTLLCPFHHHLVHEGGWDIRGKPPEGLVFLRPDGSALKTARSPGQQLVAV
jgi:hypothetical protein